MSSLLAIGLLLCISPNQGSRPEHEDESLKVSTKQHDFDTTMENEEKTMPEAVKDTVAWDEKKNMICCVTNVENPLEKKDKGLKVEARTIYSAKKDHKDCKLVQFLDTKILEHKEAEGKCKTFFEDSEHYMDKVIELMNKSYKAQAADGQKKVAKEKDPATLTEAETVAAALNTNNAKKIEEWKEKKEGAGNKLGKKPISCDKMTKLGAVDCCCSIQGTSTLVPGDKFSDWASCKGPGKQYNPSNRMKCNYFNECNWCNKQVCGKKPCP